MLHDLSTVMTYGKVYCAPCIRCFEQIKEQTQDPSVLESSLTPVWTNPFVLEVRADPCGGSKLQVPDDSSLLDTAYNLVLFSWLNPPSRARGEHTMNETLCQSEHPWMQQPPCVSVTKSVKNSHLVQVNVLCTLGPW